MGLSVSRWCLASLRTEYIALSNPFEDDDAEYLVIVNDEQQYSLWPGFREIPPGWTAAGERGDRRECLSWIDVHWTDMRPKSLVVEMERGDTTS